MGKLGRENVSLPYCGNETTTYYDRTLWNSKWIAHNTPAVNSANGKVGEKGHVFIVRVEVPSYCNSRSSRR